MARDLNKVKSKFIEGLRQIYRYSSQGANASSLTVDQLQLIVKGLLLEHNKVRQAWDDFVSLEGAAEAREILSDAINSLPSDVAAQLLTVRNNIVSILDSYGNAFGSGVPNKTFSYTLSDGLFDGGFTEEQLQPSVVSVVNSECLTLRASVEVLAPVD